MTEVERLADLIEGWCDVPGTAETIVRTLLEALREPSEATRTCSDEIHWGYACNTCGGLTEGWRAMIDYMLSEGLRRE